MVVIIACLCLSAGEGLQLRPFPVSEVVATEATNTQLHVAASNEISTEYSPTIVPTRPLNRGKQQVVKYGNPPAKSRRALTPHRLLPEVTGEVIGFIFLVLESRIPSRAPPFDS